MMDMYEVSVRSFFSAARRLDGLKHSENLHGQTFEVEVTFQAEAVDSRGVLEDYWKLREPVDELVQSLNHSVLNEHDFFKGKNPTTEVICQVLAERLREKFSQLKVYRVRIKDTPITACAYYP